MEKSYFIPLFILLEYLIQYAEKHQIFTKAFVSIPFTRQELSEELGICVKTLNRTIKKLKENNLINIVKGKIVLTSSQYEICKKELKMLICD